jgi:hypothetical protein
MAAVSGKTPKRTAASTAGVQSLGRPHRHRALERPARRYRDRLSKSTEWIPTFRGENECSARVQSSQRRNVNLFCTRNGKRDGGKRSAAKGRKAGQINMPNVAELVDARDLNSLRPLEALANFGNPIALIRPKPIEQNKIWKTKKEAQDQTI